MHSVYPWLESWESWMGRWCMLLLSLSSYEGWSFHFYKGKRCHTLVYVRTMFFQLPLAVGCFHQNVTGCKPMREENAVSGRRPEHAWAPRQETTTMPTRSIRSLVCNQLNFEKRSNRVGVGKTLCVKKIVISKNRLNSYAWFLGCVTHRLNLSTPSWDAA